MDKSSTVVDSNKKKKIGMPDTYILLFIVLILATISTYILPAGEYERETVDGITKIIEGTFSTTENTPVNFLGVFLALQSGFVNTGSIIFMILLTGAAVRIIEETGALKAGINSAIKVARGNEFLLISVITMLFGVAGGIGIISTQVIPFVLVGVFVTRAIKLDSIVAVAITFGASFVGWAASFINPFTVGIAQDIAELPLFSGILVRSLFFLLSMFVLIWYIWRYAKKILDDPNKSLLGEEDGIPLEETKNENPETLTFTHSLVLLFTFLAVAFYAYAVLSFGWSIDHMAAMMIIISIGVAIIARIKPNDFVNYFILGIQGMVYGALVVGVANATLVVLTDGQILDTVVYGLAEVMKGLPTILAASGMFISNTLINFIIPSGSGQAMVVMPIMTPLADILNVTRQTAVQAYQLGDGFSNMIIPTGGPLMASLAIAKVPYGKWLKWIMPLFLIYSGLSVLMLIGATLLNWGPF